MGIVVGVGAGGGLIMGVVGWFFASRSRRRRRDMLRGYFEIKR